MTGGGRPRSRAHARPSMRRRISHGSISTATIRMTPRNAGTAPGGSARSPRPPSPRRRPRMMRVIGTPSRSTLSISTTRIAPRHDADHAAAPAEDRGAADDHRGDDDQLGAQAELAGSTPLSWATSSARRVAQSEDSTIGADAHPARLDAGIVGRLLVAAGRVRSRSPSGSWRARRRRSRRRSRTRWIWLLKPSALISPSGRRRDIRRLELERDDSGRRSGRARGRGR